MRANANSRDVYGMDDASTAPVEVVDIRTESLPLTASALTDSNAFNFFRGCIEEVKVRQLIEEIINN